MKNNIKFLSIFILLIVMTMGAVSADDTMAIDDNSISTSSEYTITESNYNDFFDDDGNLNDSKVLDGDTLILSEGFTKASTSIGIQVSASGTVISDNTISTSNQYTINVNNVPDDNSVENNFSGSSALKTANEVMALNSNTYSVNITNYGDFFNDQGYLKNNVLDGYTLILSGDFTEKNFIINKNVTLTTLTDNRATIYNGSVILIKGASGSTVSNLKIINLACKNKQGILLKEVTNCVVKNNNINCSGESSFPIALNPGSNYNVISGNIIRASGIALEGSTKSISGIVLGGANNNLIKDNYIEVDDANGIYMSAWGSGAFEGGKCYNNVLINNTVKCMVIPTSWCYGLQLMGSNNSVYSNKIIGTYRGISTGDDCIVRDNFLINITGKDFSTGKLVGGEYAIIVGSNCQVLNNTFENCFVETAGIYVSSNSTVQDNFVNVYGTAKGIDADGNNIKIINNTINTTSGVGISQIGKLSGLFVSNNLINSSTGIGIYIGKSSNTKFPYNITLINNTISTSNAYAINAKDADKDSYVIADNRIDGSSEIYTPDGVQVPEVSFNFDGTVHYVTPDNYHTFFDDNGDLVNVNVKEGDILSFTGEFNEVFPVISSSIKLTGDNAVFKNSTITVTSNGVWIENLKIINANSSHLNNWGIYANDLTKLMIINNTISVSDKNAAYAIYLNSVSEATVKDNVLYSSGDYLTYTIVALGLEKSTISNNKILTNGTGQVHAYESYKCLDGNNTVNEVYRTYGILLVTSSNNQILTNNVTVTSKLDKTVYNINGALVTNSLVGIDAYFDCNDNLFDNNNVLVYGNDNYIYGMGVIGAETNSGSSLASNNKFRNNTIIVKGNNVGTGLICGYNTVDSTISGNTIDVVATNSAYGITLEYAKSSKINGNNASLKSDISYVIEMFDADNNIISGNKLNSTGAYGFGIAGYGSSNNTITDNEIAINYNGDKEVTISNHADALGYGNAGVFLMADSTKNIISNNYITSAKGYAVNVSDVSANTISDNYLKGESTFGDNAVLGSARNTVKDNWAYEFVNPTLEDVSTTYLGTVTLIANTGIANDDKTTVKFYIDNKYIGSATAINGKATLTLKLDEKAGSYSLSAEFTRENYREAIATASLNIVKGNLNIVVPSVLTKKGTSTVLKATVYDDLGNPVKDIAVFFYRGSQYIGRGTTDANGVAQITNTIPSDLAGDYHTLKAMVAESDIYNSAEGLGELCYDIQLQSSNLVKDYKNDSQYNVKVLSPNGNPIAGVTVNVYLTSKSFNNLKYPIVTNDEGIATLEINLQAGEYSIRAEAGSKSLSTKITVLDNTYKLNSKDIIMVYKDGTAYTIELKDKNNNVLANEPVTVSISSSKWKNPATYKITTNSNGVAKLAINLATGVYSIKATYQKASVTNTINVAKDKNSVALQSSDVVKYYKNGTQYTVVVKDINGNVLAGKSVAISIKGSTWKNAVTYNVVTNANGVATLVINLGAGTYTVTASASGVSCQNSIKVLSTITVNNLVKSVKQTASLSAKLVDGQGIPLSNHKITFTIKGKVYTKTTNSESIATLPINLGVGTWSILIANPETGAQTRATVKVTK